jgi:hypothetical protein
MIYLAISYHSNPKYCVPSLMTGEIRMKFS